jgi:hypothetical protein
LVKCTYQEYFNITQRQEFSGITNNQNVTQYFKFHVDKDEYGNKVARVQKYSQGDDGQYYLDPENQYSLQGRFDVKISTGSSLPFEKSRVEQQVL